MAVIDSTQCKLMFNNIPPEYNTILAGENKDKLAVCIKKLTSPDISKINSLDEITPPLDLVFNAFRLCPPSKLRVIIIGQDPYPSKNTAHGLSFSVLRNCKIPPSLRNVFAALIQSEQIQEMPKHGCLEYWAQQGILLLNSALTTKIGSSGAHIFWHSYTNSVLKSITKLYPGLIILLWGNDAKAMEKHVENSDKHIILKWGHPSPMSSVNGNRDNPAAFINCDHFKQVNDILAARGETQIDWNLDSNKLEPKCEELLESKRIPLGKLEIVNSEVELVVVPQDPIIVDQDANTQSQEDNFDTQETVVSRNTIYLACDGGATANGKSNCRASWAYVIRAIDKYPKNNDTFMSDANFLVECEKNGILLTTDQHIVSNNVGELTAILNGLTHILNTFVCTNMQGDIYVLSDSKYAINCVDVWIHNWLKDPERNKLSEKKNLHLIVPIKNLIEKIRVTNKVTFIHIGGHGTEPQARKSKEWFLWSLNDRADQLCQTALK